MKYEKNDNKLTLFFEGSLSSTNFEVVERDINSTLEGKAFDTLILDFNNLKYISSAGLRVILRLKQKFDNTSIVGASLEVYDTLSMTGFTDIIPTKKALRKILVANSEVIGQGFFSTVYRIDKDTIIKVFNRTSDSEQIERELKLAKEAFVLGIPTAISFDIVQVEDGKLGVRFELLNSVSLRDKFINSPEKWDEYLMKYVELLKKINTTECNDPQIPAIKNFYLEKLDKIKPNLDQKYFDKALKMVEGIEDRKTFVHGDCHFKNIMVQDDELLLIDMDTLSVGHPIFELAQLFAPYCAFNEDEPGNSDKFFGFSEEQCLKLYNGILDNYFGKDDKVIKDKIRLLGYIHMVWWNRTNEPQNNVRLEGCRSRLYKLLDEYDDLNI